MAQQVFCLFCLSVNRALIYPLASTSHCYNPLKHDGEETMVLMSCQITAASGPFLLPFFALVCSPSVFCFFYSPFCSRVSCMIHDRLLITHCILLNKFSSSTLYPHFSFAFGSKGKFGLFFKRRTAPNHQILYFGRLSAEMSKTRIS